MTSKVLKQMTTEATSEDTKVFYFHYAWVIVAIIAAMQMVGTSIRMAFGVFIEPLSYQFGWSQTGITFAYALSSIVSAVASPLAGSIGDRVGARKTLILGTLLFLVGMIATGYVTNLWQLYITYGVVLGIAQSIFLVPLIPAAMTWFRRHLGLGMGLIMASWGAGPALAAPIIGLLIGKFGWQLAFWITGIVSATIMAILITKFANSPSDKGLIPYGALSSDLQYSVKRPSAEQLRKFSGYMQKTAGYWNMSSIHFLGCVGHAVILIYIIPLAIYEGLSLVEAASILTIMSLTSLPSRVLTPFLCEKLGVRSVMATFYVLQAVPVIMVFWSHDLWSFYIFAGIFGVGYGGETGGFPILNRKYYGHAPMGVPHGFQMFGAGLGMALGGWIGGIIHDLLGTYDWAMIVSIVASLGGAVSIALLESPSQLLIPDWDTIPNESETQP